MDKEKLMEYIKECRASGKDPHAEAAKRLADVIKGLEMNTAPYRLAWSKPLGFYALHTTKEAIDILTTEAKKNNA